MLNQDQIAAEFPLDAEVIYLNHAAVAPWPARTANAIADFTRENVHYGAKYYPRWLETETFLRKQLQALINAPSHDDIALLKNTSEALSVVAHGVDWHAGDNVVICNQEFPSNRIVWESLRQYGVDVNVVDIANETEPESLLIAACNQRTRLLSVSSVQYANGLRMDLHRLGEHCTKNNILYCVDAIQSLGALPFDAQSIHADFVMADGHKWMLGPEGLALFYCRAALRAQLKLRQFGWHMVQDMANFDAVEWAPAVTARRFECGSPNMLCIHALSASLSLLLEMGIEAIASRLLERTACLLEAIKKYPQLTLLTNPHPSRLSGIVTFKHQARESEQLYARLMKKSVICAHRGGGIRFSPHFYTDLAKIQTAVELSTLTD